MYVLFRWTVSCVDSFFKKNITLKNNVCSSFIIVLSVVTVDYQKRNKKVFNMENVSKKPLLCELCDYTCSLKSNLKRHILSVHEGNKPFKCDICDYSCSQKSSMNQHVLSVHEGNKLFKCNICGYKFSQKGKMNQHVALVHNEKKPFKCNTCDATFSSNRNMKTHVSKIHGGKNLWTIDKLSIWINI